MYAWLTLELDYTFSFPVAQHASYQGTKVLPYAIKRCFNKNAKLEPLYDFDVPEYQDVYESDVKNVRTEDRTEKV